MNMDTKCIDLRRELLRLKLEKFIMLGLRMDDIPNIRGQVVIYGAGTVGKLLLRCFEKKPDVFWDKRLCGQEICSIPVYSVQEGVDRLSKNKDTTIIVTPVWDFEKICNEVEGDNPFVTVISLEELLEKL